MLDFRKNRWLQAGSVLFLVGAALLVLPSYRDYCETNDANDYYCAAYETVATFFALVQSYNGAFVVFATIAIAWFTLSLRELTHKLGEIADATASAKSAILKFCSALILMFSPVVLMNGFPTLKPCRATSFSSTLAISPRPRLHGI